MGMRDGVGDGSTGGGGGGGGVGDRAGADGIENGGRLAATVAGVRARGEGDTGSGDRGARDGGKGDGGLDAAALDGAAALETALETALDGTAALEAALEGAAAGLAAGGALDAWGTACRGFEDWDGLARRFSTARDRAGVGSASPHV